MVKERLLISACILKPGYKYDGGSNIQAQIENLADKYELVLICPEVMGGLPVPRHKSERIGEKVLMDNGDDVTLAFQQGAARALEIAQKFGCKKALLKAKSPSCGKGFIYDGSFTHTLITGNGVTADLFLKQGIVVYTEKELDKL